MSHRRKHKKHGFFGRMMRSLFSIVILSAFVIGIALFTKELSSLETAKLSGYIKPLLALFGLEDDVVTDVAGEFVQRVTATRINSSQVKADVNLETLQSDRKILFKIGLIADTGDENEMLQKGIKAAEAQGVDQIIHLGDLTAWGDVKSLKEAKAVLDTSEVEWAAIPGDHDIADSLGTQNFVEVFGEPNRVISVKGKNILLFNNSANFTPIESLELDWLFENLKSADIVIFSQPLYHEFNPLVMGVFDGAEDRVVRGQADEILDNLRSSGVIAVVAADHHKSSKGTDPVKNTMTHYVVGAAAVERNLQRPRIAVMTVYDNGSLTVDDVVLE